MPLTILPKIKVTAHTLPTEIKLMECDTSIEDRIF